jgi:hypothetical protein
MTDTYAEQVNGQAPPETRVKFGTARTQSVPVEWAAWILTAMREAELAGRKPQHFSAWLAAAGREVS